MDDFHSLVHDTLSYAKDPLQGHPSFFHAPLLADPIKTAPLPAAPATLPPVAKTKPTVDIKSTLQTLLPTLKLTEKIPDDMEGKVKAMLWKEKIADVRVVLLALSTDEPTLELLKSLAKAIDTRLAKAKIIPAERLEKEKQWPHFFSANTFDLVIVSFSLNQYPELAKLYPTNLQQKTNTPFLFLEQAAVYKQIEKKAELWKTIHDCFCSS